MGERTEQLVSTSGPTFDRVGCALVNGNSVICAEEGTFKSPEMGTAPSLPRLSSTKEEGNEGEEAHQPTLQLF